MTESPKPPPRPAAQPASAPSADKPATAKGNEGKAAGPPPPPQRQLGKPAATGGAAAAAPGTSAAAAPAPAASVKAAGADVVLPPASPAAMQPAPLTREPARDTLAPSSFGVLGSNKPPAAAAPAPSGLRAARAPLNTLGELEGATATATLRPPGAVPPPPRALPTSSIDTTASERDVQATPLPGDAPFTAFASNPQPSPRSPEAKSSPTRQRSGESAAPTLPPAAAATLAHPSPDESALESTLDMSGSASKKAAQAALIERTRTAESQPARPPSAVPAPGLFIADEPVEPRPKQGAPVAPQPEAITRMRVALFVLGGVLLMLAGALVVMIFRRSEAVATRAAAPSASALPTPPGCRLALPPSRISPTIERSVPISAVALADGDIALAIADTKTTATGWVYDPVQGEPKRQLGAAAVNGDVTHVVASEPLQVDHTLPDFSFGRSLARGLSIGVGPAGLLRRGADGATGVVWPLPTGARVTAPRVASLPAAHFVAFRQGGAEGQVQTGWLKADGSAASELHAIAGAPISLGTPTAAKLGERAVTLFSARPDKSSPYEIHAAISTPTSPPARAKKVSLPAFGSGAIAPSLAELSPGRYLLQWTDGGIGQYQVHTIVVSDDLEPLGPPLRVSAKGANAGQGTIVASSKATVSFFIQTTAGHDELWGATLSCR